MAWTQAYEDFYKNKGYSTKEIAKFKADQLKEETNLAAQQRASNSDVALGDLGRYNTETGGLALFGEDKNTPLYSYNPKTNTTMYGGQKFQGKISPDVIEAMAPAFDVALNQSYDQYLNQAEKTPDKVNVLPSIQQQEQMGKEMGDLLGQGTSTAVFSNWQRGKQNLSQESLDSLAMSQAMKNLTKGYNKNEYLQGLNKDFWGQFDELNTGKFSGK